VPWGEGWGAPTVHGEESGSVGSCRPDPPVGGGLRRDLIGRLLTVETAWLRTFYVLFAIGIGSRRVCTFSGSPGTRLSMGHPASQKPRGGGAATGGPVPDPRPGRQVLRSVRRGVPFRGREGHREPDPSALSECVRGAVGPHGPDGMFGLDTGTRLPPPGASPSDLHLPLQRPKAASRPRLGDAEPRGLI
jgi:hypothetical protein